MKQTCDDAALGRMSVPRELEESDLSQIAIASRFGVEQGKKADGSVKVRAVDDATAAGVNPACAATERLHLRAASFTMARRRSATGAPP